MGIHTLAELRDHVRAEEIARAAGTHTPSLRLLGIGPEEIAHGSIMRHFLFAIERADLIQTLDRRGQPAMHTEDLQ